MKQDDIHQSMEEIDQWMRSAEEKWKDAKPILEENIETDRLNQWETKLNTLKTDLDHLKSSRTDDVDEDFILNVREINQQCNELYKDYNHFTEEISRKYSENDDNTNQTNQEEQEEQEDDRKELKKKDKNTSQGDRIPPGGHKLPPLPYSYDALEPTISEEIMRLHHDIHHKSYVDCLNKAETKMKEARQSGNYDFIRHWEREAAFNGAGHYLHTIFWHVMSPKGGGKPKGALLKQIIQDFGSYEAFKHHFTEAAKNVEGVGWAILVWSPRSHRLEILQAEKHQNLSQWDIVPLLVLDVWEHAYYLQYKTDKGQYVDNWWNVVNWDTVAKRFDQAKKLRWTPY